MANVELQSTQPINAPARNPEARTREAGGGGSIVEAIAGVGAVVLAIIGLLGALPVTLASIATIALGAALLLEGGAIATRLYATLDREGGQVPSELSGGLGAESLAGIAALALGILALVGIDSFICLQAAVIVLGAGLLFSGAAIWRVNYPRLGGYTSNESAGYAAREAIQAASGAHSLVGIGVIVLGILALLGMSPMTLVLVAVLSIGGATVLSGAAIGGRFLAPLRR
jgi:hypothetical protein